ncbi:hypothetical protein RU86_GL001660 [Lactococcus piscium]|uniref:Uncharacterized protein n=1 Tax=Pseudolactococcus piscium TaxID=1364 RepID=A0A2A5RUB1_9LACT|nr:hypothetical protein [Lactococcus piscium]PCS04065.1 hypothetical protein RU86_GL001660 [Lactococcus piscium]
MKDKNADKRYAYDLKISDEERKIEELYAQEGQLKQSLEAFQYEITSSFQTLKVIEDELNYRNHGSSSFSETQEKQKYLDRMIANQQASQDLQFKRIHQKREEQRETLIRERSSLSWD